MRIEEADLLQDLLVLAAGERGDDVLVSVYGSRENVCGTVRFTFGDPAARARSLRVLQRWAADDTPVALLARGDELSLFSERAVLRRALERAR